MFFLIFTTIVTTFYLYIRYFPIFDMPCVQLNDLELDRIKTLDLRDYNESYKEPMNGAINIPISYLKRNLNEIPNEDLHLIVSSMLEKNLAIRYLRKKGYRIVGFTCINQTRFLLKEKSYKIKTNC